MSTILNDFWTLYMIFIDNDIMISITKQIIGKCINKQKFYTAKIRSSIPPCAYIHRIHEY